MATRRTLILTLQGVDEETILRATKLLLKRLLRDFGVRCTGARMPDLSRMPRPPRIDSAPEHCHALHVQPGAVAAKKAYRTSPAGSVLDVRTPCPRCGSTTCEHPERNAPTPAILDGNGKPSRRRVVRMGGLSRGGR